jgi:peptidoglycan/LPS O-acetylase OafA/YrhL
LVLLSPTSLAMESVAIFFLISGFLVGGQIWRNVCSDTFQWKRFLVDRLTRLWIVLIPGLIISGVVANLIKHNFNSLKFSSADFSTIGCNLIFMMPTRCQPYASNESLWTLGYEFYFYLLFVFSVMLFKKNSSLNSKLLNTLGIAAVLFVFSIELLSLFFAWFMGYLVFMFSSKSKHSQIETSGSNLHILAILLIIFGSVISNTLIQSEKHVIILISIFGSFAIFLSAKSDTSQKKPRNVFTKLFDFLGRSSFSIYVFHLPVMQLSYFMLGNRLQTMDVLLIYSVSVFSIFVSAVLYFLFEKHTFRSRTIAYKMLGI